MDSNLQGNRPLAAYFCMEYALDSDISLYAGGLGILAGDYLKTSRDMGYPTVGIGILWKQGYTSQKLDKSGRVYDSYFNHTDRYDFLEDTGVKVSVRIKDTDVFCKVWKTEAFSNNPLYLLDTDIPENAGTELRLTTGQLYGWFDEQRVAQEIVLGIGGVRALRSLGIEPEIFHFNEGHAVFAGFELIREKLEKGANFETALETTRESIVFTTHTPVEQGNESHSLKSLFYMGANNGLESKELEAIGGNPFNMTVAGLRLSKISNGVSRLHSKTAVSMWRKFDRISEIIQVTNGIHMPTWVDEEILQNANDGEYVWGVHAKNKRLLVDYVLEKTGSRFKEDVMTIGFARRAAPYKRAGLILEHESEIERLIAESKIQIVFSGKAHPFDDEGKRIVKRLYEFCRSHPENAAFIQDYDMETAMVMTKGCDIWLNSPRKPYEASGTSGMKAALNGVLNLSVLDGWWDEACIDGENGWQFGDGFESADHAQQDRKDGESLMKVLVEKVIPLYYDGRDKWIGMMKRSIQTNRERFLMERAIDEYYRKMYEFRL